jgi:pimeloyl-ACP methyl ester carboxylesterase
MTSTATAIVFRDVSLPTGVRLRYADVGPPSGRPLLLLHGYSDSWFSFSPILDLVSPELRLIVPDQRGHGESDRPIGGYTAEGFATDAIALLEALGIESATVVGHSMGSFAAQRIATLAPERVDTLVLVGSAATSNNEVIESLLPDVQSLTDPVDVDFVRAFQMSTIYRPVPPEFLEKAIAESLKLPARVWQAVLAGLLNMPVLLGGSTAIECPALILWGNRDAIFNRKEQDELLNLIPNARLQVLNEVGHAVHWEAPDEFVQRLNEAIK